MFKKLLTTLLVTFLTVTQINIVFSEEATEDSVFSSEILNTDVDNVETIEANDTTALEAPSSEEESVEDHNEQEDAGENNILESDVKEDDLQEGENSENVENENNVSTTQTEPLENNLTLEPEKLQETELLSQAPIPDDLDVYSYILNNSHTGTYLFEEGAFIGEYDSIELLKFQLDKLSSDPYYPVWEGNILKSIPVANADVFTLLSNTHSSIYQNADIQKADSFTGIINIKDIVLNDTVVMTFNGLGSRDNKFSGKLTMNSFYLSKPLFKYIDLKNATIKDNSIEIYWVSNNNEIAVFAENADSDGSKTLEINIKTPTEKFLNVTASLINNLYGGLNLTVITDGNCGIKNVVPTITSTSDIQNAGGIINTYINNGDLLELTFNGMFKEISVLANTSSVLSNKGNAGAIIGYGNGNVKINASELPASIIQAPFGSAGGVIGLYTGNDDTLKSLELSDVNLSNVAVSGYVAGGLIGNVDNIKLRVNNSLVLPNKVGDSGKNLHTGENLSSLNAGGLFGKYAYSVDESLTTIDSNLPISYTNIELSAIDNVGGIIGSLSLSGNQNFYIKGIDNAINVSNTFVSNTTVNTKLGGIIGYISSTGTNNIYIDNVSLESMINATPKYYGGLIAYVEGKTYVEISNTNIFTPKPIATNCYGGLLGRLDNSIVKISGSNTVSTYDEDKGYPYKPGQTSNSVTESLINVGGGLIGNVSNSVIELNGTTDLTKTGYLVHTYDNRNNIVGQLIGTFSNNIFYSNGNGDDATWTLNRSEKGFRIDDIGTYDEIIRNANGLFSVNEGIFSYSKNYENGDNRTFGTIKDTDDFILHALCFKTEGFFNLLDVNTKEQITEVDIHLADNIDLSNTGVYSLTRDHYDLTPGFIKRNNHVTFEGNNNTITYIAGESFGLRNGVPATGDGSGLLYRHNRAGLFGEVGNITIQNLNVVGTLNMGADYSGTKGLLIGKLYSAPLNLFNVKVSGTIVFNSSTEQLIGGVIGHADAKNGDINIYDLVTDVNIDYNGIPAANQQDNASNASTSANNAGYVKTANLVGNIDGNKNSSVNIANANLNGSIDDDGVTYAVGGLIANIKTLKEVNIWNTNINQVISNKSSTSSGGFLGYYWNDVDVNFNVNTSGSDTIKLKLTDEDRNDFAISINGSSISTSGDLGGLCYAANGKWLLSNKAVKLDNTTLSNGNKTLGLLVNTGFKQSATAGTYNENGNALYLCLDNYWGDAYQVNNNIVTGQPSGFDEFVLKTANADIMENGAGLISLKTKDGSLLTTTNSYVNRTDYGTDKKNNLSRYYYNIDAMTVNGGIDKPEELVLWSLNKYVASNIKKYIPRINTNVLGVGTNVDIDLNGYSYYPVNIDSTDITIQNLNVIFNNVGTCEKTNFSSQGQTQHMLMHSGLFYNLSANNKESILTLSNSKLSGNIGKIGSKSGVLIVKQAKGSSENSRAIIMIKNSQIDNSLKVDGFKAGDENSLLINEVASFSKIDISGLSADSGEPSASSLIGNVGVKNSTEKVEGIILSFDNIKLPDKQGRFNDATLLKSFYYDQNSSAVYNFTKEEDWDNNEHVKNVTYGFEIGGTEQYKNSSNNPKQQKYLLSKEFVSHTGNNFTGTADSFADFLPYVKYSPATNNTDYSNAKNYYEIKVNDAYVDIEEGCGSYSDPFIINESLDLKTVAEYISTGQPSIGWKINVVNGIDNPCDKNYHTQYEYLASGIWENANGDTKTNAKMREYMASAYYLVTDDINLGSFDGLGTSEYQFKGVIVGRKSDETRPTITFEGKNPKFITSSYGSVVKDLILDYSASNINLLYVEISKDYTSRTFFGGVMGSVMGGDNIIDNVTVTMGNIELDSSKTPFLIPVGAYVGVISGGGVIFRNMPSTSFSVKIGNNTINSNDEHQFDGKGVITRGTYFYVNNYVGRVLEGYAFSEDCTVNNTSKNYKINKLTDEKDITVDGNNIRFENAQGLLIYSNLLSSGSASYGVTKSYTYGKSRKAAYSSVGKTDNNKDWALAIEDGKPVSDTNLPYLNYKYTNGLTSLADKKVSYALNGGTYDLSTYENGYKAIGPKYMSNAVMDNNGNITLANINPAVIGFNGNNAVVIVNEMVRCYSKDDHFAVAVGGIFNTLNFAKDALIQNVEVKGKGKNTESLGIRYYKAGTGVTLVDDTWTVNHGVLLYDNLLIRQGRHHIGVGGLAGNLPTNPDENNYNTLINYSEKRYGNRVSINNVHVSDIDIVSPWNAGGIIGQSGLKDVQDYKDNYSIVQLLGGYNTKGKMFSTSYDFINCTYSNANIEGGIFAGGYIGLLSQGGSTSAANNTIRTLNYLNDEAWRINVNFGDDNVTAGSNSKIVAQRRKNDNGIDKDRGWNGSSYNVINNCLPASGGLFGYMSFTLNMGTDNKNIEFNDVSVMSGRSAGGIVAWSASPLYLNGITIKGKTNNGENLSDREQMTRIGDNAGPNADNTKNYDYYAEFAGGILGYDERAGSTKVVKNFTIENMLLAASKSSSWPSYAGATFSDISGASISVFSNIEITNNILSTKYYAVNAKGCTGGIAGRIEKDATIYVYNTLLDDNILESSDINLAGNLIGIVGEPGSTKKIAPTIKMYGISVQNSTGLNTTERVIGTNNNSGLNYYVFTDYYGDSTNSKTDRNVSLINDFKQIEPYAITSPIRDDVVTLDGKDVHFYGDGSNPQTVLDIYNDSVNKDKGVRFYYEVSDKEINNNIASTYLTEMKRVGEEGFDDFPVLSIPVANSVTTTKTIVNYLDIATNGGYSAVMDKKGTGNLKVDISISLYEERDNGTFVKVNKSTPLTNEANNFYTYYDWDSGKNRFELLTIKIYDKCSNEEFIQEINVPIVVRRVMEIDFTANFLQGAVFEESTFLSNNNLLTANFNENVTAYLSYKYNTEKDYDFQSMAENRIKLGPINKELSFTNSNSTFKSLPNGTQLILLDRQRNNNAYYLNLSGQDGVNATTVNLSDFVDSNGHAYQERWVSELLNLDIKPDTSGLWYLTDEEHATLKYDGQFYRIKENTDTVESNMYSITFTEDVFEEKYYLVVFIPNSSLEIIENKNGANQKNDLNGYIGTDLSFTGDILYNLNYKLINGTDEDSRVQTPSTYSFLSGYSQTITDMTNTDEFDIYNLFTGGNDKYINVDVIDKIHISEGQAFEASTSMFYRLDLSLPYYSKKGESDNIVLTESNGFPLGCYSDNVEFFVYTMKDGVPTYYTYSNGAWYPSSDKIATYGYEWNSNGSNMKLMFGDGNTAMSLAGLRTMLLNPANSDLNHDLYIETSMHLYMSTMAVEKVIAGSTVEGGAYTKVNYTGLIASSVNEFESTTYNTAELGKVRYWQSVTGLSEITLNANDPAQLGINVNDMAQADGIILLTGIYDLSKMSNPDKVLAKSAKIDFELSLQQKQGDGTYIDVDINDYISNIKINGYSGTTYSDRKTNGSWETLNDTKDKFIIPIRLEVKTEIESTNKSYSSYRIVLKGAIKDNNNETVNTPKNTQDYITYIITRINTNGIWE